jgi:hypothetical protein
MISQNNFCTHPDIHEPRDNGSNDTGYECQLIIRSLFCGSLYACFAGVSHNSTGIGVHVSGYGKQNDLL